MSVRAFSLLHQCPPRCSRPFSRTKDNLSPFKPGSSRVASSDLLDFAPSQDIWALGQTPINVQKLKQLFKDYPNKSDAVFLAEGFEFGFKPHYERGGGVGWCDVLGKVPVPGRPTIWIIVGQGPIAFAVGAGGGCLDIFTLIYPFSPLSPSLWKTARYRLKYCLKGPLNPKQPTNNLPAL